ncbi:MAG: hypothetical protein GY928_32815 [Colwellia sp.]|nr:hypothetical protein [Colwellia sp.]
MSFFKLTIAEDDIEKRTQSYQNLQAILGAMLIAITLTITSGFWYLLVPHDINWNASQSIMVLHLVAGICASMLLFVFFFLHQKDKNLAWWQFLLPWTIKRKQSTSSQHWQQRLLGALLTWLFIAIFGTGFLIALPAVLFHFGIIELHGYGLQKVLNFSHQNLSIAMLPVFLLHMLWLVRKC